MKVLVHSGKIPAAGGILSAGSAMIQALKSVGVEVTVDSKDTYDLVDINYFLSGAKSIIKKAKKKGIPVIIHAHSTEADFKYGFKFWKILSHVGFYPLMWKIYKSADLIIPVSRFGKYNLESEINYKNIPMKVINNSIDLNQFRKNSNYIEEFEKYFNIDKDDKVVVNFALPFERKGIYDFLEVAKLNPDVKFIWFGEYKGIMFQRKIKKAIKHRPKNVIMPGYIRNNVFFGALQRANCVFYPSFVEIDGCVALEAMASKTPLLVRDIGAMEWLTNHVHCFKGNNVEEFNEALNYILNNDTSFVVKNAYKKVQERDLEIIGNQLKQVYQDLIDKKKNEIKNR